MERKYNLLFHCPDRSGIVRDVSSFFTSEGYNINYLRGVKFEDHFAVRVTAEKNEISIDNNLKLLRENFDGFVKRLGESEAEWKINRAEEKKNVAVLVSKSNHCLYSLLQDLDDGNSLIKINSVIGNHDNCRRITEAHGIDFHLLSSKDKKEMEEEILGLTGGVDFLVAARYMQILSSNFISESKKPIVNVHHGTLPEFAGGSPYERGHSRGVKQISATAHFITEELDGGPIIFTCTRDVPDGASLSEFKNIGKHAESEVLSRAIKLVADDRVIAYKNKTFRFMD